MARRYDSSVGASLFVLVVILIIYSLIDWATCSAKADRMDIDSDYGPIQGCMVEARPGKWVPLERYRVVDDE